MKVEEALIRLRDDLKEWVTNNLNAIGKPKASDVTITTPEGMEATDAQNAIVELNGNFGGLTFGKDGDGNCGYYGADGSLIPFSVSGFLKKNQMLKNGVVSEIENDTFTIERNALNFYCLFVPKSTIRTVTTKQNNMNVTIVLWYADGTSETKSHASATTLTATKEIALASVFTINSSTDSRVSTVTLS
jgi:hypothetical protein